VSRHFPPFTLTPARDRRRLWIVLKPSGIGLGASHHRLLATELKVLDRSVPINDQTAMQTTAINAAINPYSIAVTPDSSVDSLAINAVIGGCLSCPQRMQPNRLDKQRTGRKSRRQGRGRAGQLRSWRHQSVSRPSGAGVMSAEAQFRLRLHVAFKPKPIDPVDTWPRAETCNFSQTAMLSSAGPVGCEPSRLPLQTSRSEAVRNRGEGVAQTRAER
jgi:hypothetical protein